MKKMPSACKRILKYQLMGSQDSLLDVKEVIKSENCNGTTAN